MTSSWSRIYISLCYIPLWRVWLEARFLLAIVLILFPPSSSFLLAFRFPHTLFNSLLLLVVAEASPVVQQSSSGGQCKYFFDTSFLQTVFYCMLLISLFCPTINPIILH